LADGGFAKIIWRRFERRTLLFLETRSKKNSVAITKLIVSSSRNCPGFACCLTDGWDVSPPEIMGESESDDGQKESKASVEYDAEAAL